MRTLKSLLKSSLKPLATVVIAGWAMVPAVAGNFSVIHSFTTSPGKPMSTPLLATDGNYYGTTTDGNGSIYKLTPAGTLSLLHTFTVADGYCPQGDLIQAPDGYLYGAAKLGGDYGLGTAFKINLSGQLTVLHSFNGGDGQSPQGLTRSADGTFYGACASGGTNNQGTVFKIGSGGFAVLGNLAGVALSTPSGSLVVAGDNNLYGVARSGGDHADGGIFKLTTGGSLSVLHSFADTEGTTPIGSLALGADGKLYGTTSQTTDWMTGTFYSCTTGGTFALLHTFSFSDPDVVSSKLTLGSDGNFYGASTSGGDNGRGTVFELTPAGEVTVLHSFSSIGDDGQSSFGGVLRLGDGSLIGSTLYGGAYHRGAIFKLSADGSTETVLSAFAPLTNEGASPASSLVLGPDGSLYGTTQAGGAYNYGTVFKLDNNGTVTTLHSFNNNDGSNPQSTLIVGADGSLYGATSNGGPDDCGTMFKVTPGGVFTNLHFFTSLDGPGPVGNITQDGSGNLYCATYAWIYKIDPTTLTATQIYRLTQQGQYPNGGVTMGIDSLLYGVLTGGGADTGSIWRCSTLGEFTVLSDTQNVVGQVYPISPMTLAADGKLYGLTAGGSVYSVDTNGTITILYSVGSGGLKPQPAPAIAPDGTIYGALALYYSTFPNSILYKGLPGTDAQTSNVVNFNGVNGYNALGLLTLGNRLYGTTNACGSGGGGNIFRLTIGVPVAPSNLTATPMNLRVKLTWSSRLDADTYNIYRGTSAGAESATPIVTGIAGGTWTDTTIVSGTVYYYKVAAVNDAGTGAQSAEVWAKPIAAAAHFLKVDTATLGNWKDNYGSEGYNVIGDRSENNPHYRAGLTVTPGTHNSGVWVTSPLVPSALQSTTAGSANRIAGVWSNTTWTTNFNLAGTHQVALYLLDYPNAGYAETITIKDAVTGATLDTRSASSFQTGAYYVWTVTGNVNITLTSTAGHWAVLSGIFFGGPSGSKSPTAPSNLAASTVTNGINLTWIASTGATTYNVYRGTTAGAESTTPIATGIKTASYLDKAATPNATYYYKVVAVNAYAGSFASNESSATAPAPTSSAIFVKTDTSTQGNWKGNYGIDGYNVIGDTSGTNPVYPSYATVTPSTHTAGVWAASTSNLAALQKVATGSTDRIAGTWFNTTWSMNVSVTGGSHQLALYFLDYPNAGYAETITIKDAATGYVLDTRYISGFQAGKYEVWNVSGNVTVTLTSTGGHWAPISGMFFG